jgi:hypothetical protein
VEPVDALAEPEHDAGLGEPAEAAADDLGALPDGHGEGVQPPLGVSVEGLDEVPGERAADRLEADPVEGQETGVLPPDAEEGCDQRVAVVALAVGGEVALREAARSEAVVTAGDRAEEEEVGGGREARCRLRTCRGNADGTHLDTETSRARQCIQWKNRTVTSRFPGQRFETSGRSRFIAW